VNSEVICTAYVLSIVHLHYREPKDSYVCRISTPLCNIFDSANAWKSSAYLVTTHIQKYRKVLNVYIKADGLRTLQYPHPSKIRIYSRGSNNSLVSLVTSELKLAQNFCFILYYIETVQSCLFFSYDFRKVFRFEQRYNS